MNLAELRQLQSDFLKFDLDNYAANAAGEVSAAEQNKQLNWAYRILSRRLKIYDPKVPLTLVAGEDVVDLRNTTPGAKNSVGRKVILPRYVIINGFALREASGREFGMWSMDELERYRPTWRTDPSAKPTKAVYYGNSKMRLHPAPSAEAVTVAGNFIAGQILPGDMADDNDVPEIPEELHEAIAYVSAVFAADPVASESEAWQRLSQFRKGYWTDLLAEIADDNERHQQSWGSTDLEDPNELINL